MEATRYVLKYLSFKTRMKNYFVLFAALFLQNISHCQCSADFLNIQTFRHVIQPQFVLFYAPWCSYCKQLLPTWNQLAEKSQEQKKWNDITISKVNCGEETAFCSAQNIVAYPTMKLFHDGDVTRFDGRQSLYDLEMFIEQVFINKVPIEEEDGLLTLTNENFDAHIKQGIALHFVDFYAPWCIHCKHFEPTWKAIAQHYQDNPDITIGKVDCTVQTSKCKKWGVDSFPTLAMFQDGHKLEKYEGSRDIEALKTYINEMLYQHGLRVDKNGVRESEKTTEAPVNTEENLNIHSNMFTNSDEDTMNSNPVVEVHARTFDMLVEQEPVFINFYVPWSEESKVLHETWKSLGKRCQKEGLTTIAQIDCSRYSEICKKYEIIHYPTLILFKGGHRYHYNEEKSLNSLHQFVKKHFHDEL